MIYFPMCQDSPQKMVYIFPRCCELGTAHTLLFLNAHFMLELPAPLSTLCLCQQKEANNHIPLLTCGMVN